MHRKKNAHVRTTHIEKECVCVCALYKLLYKPRVTETCTMDKNNSQSASTPIFLDHYLLETMLKSPLE